LRATGVSVNEWPNVRGTGAADRKAAANLAIRPAGRKFGYSVADSLAPRKASVRLTGTSLATT
jgi:hypothetical protein